MKLIDKILEDFSILKDVNASEVDDFQNPMHIVRLKEVMASYGIQDEVINPIIRVITEKDGGDGLSDKEKEKAKKMGLVSLGYGNYGKEKGGETTHQAVDGKLVTKGDGEEPEKETKPPMKIDANPFDDKEKQDTEDEKEKNQKAEQKIKKTKKQIKIGEDLKEDLDFILENKDKVRLKSGGGSNSPSVQDVKDLQTFTQKRMEQDKRRLEAEEKGEEFNEEPYVHPSIVQREVDDATLDRAIDYLEESLEQKEYEALIKRFAKGGAVPRHLTKLTKLKKDQPGYPGLDKESPGYKRAREIIRLYLKNDAKSPVTGKPLPLSHMEPDHRVPFSTAESDIVESGKFKGLSEKAKKPADGNSIQEIMKKKKDQLTDYDKKVITALEPLQAKYDDPTSNMDLMAGPVNQFKGSLINDKLLTSIRKKLAENPEEKRLQDEYTSERKRLIENYHRDAVENGSVPPYHESVIRNADKVETNAIMKGHNYYHPDAKTITMYLHGDKSKGIEADPDYYEKVKTFWAKKGVKLPDSVDDVDFKKSPFNQTMTIYVTTGSARGRANRRKTGDDHEYMVEYFKNQNYFGSTLQEDKDQEQVIDDARKKVNKTLDMKRIKILKLQLQDPELGNISRKNRQKELDSLTALYGDEE